MGSLNLPIFFIRNYQKLNIDSDLLILLTYLYNKECLLDLKRIKEDLNMEEKKVLEDINKLQEKGLINIVVEKNKKGIMEEKISLEPLFNKLSLLLMEDDALQEEKTNIYQLFEEEFGRTLSPMEFSIITEWLKAEYKEEVIIEALKEAVFNGVSNLRYIDKILFEWHKKGLKRVEDIRKDRKKYLQEKKVKVEIPDYNWLEDEEEK